jgi:hypothetical protein
VPRPSVPGNAVITARTIVEQGPARPPGPGGATLLAAALIVSPLLQWLHLTVLSYFTLLEPPFTTSRGIVLAMQLFFSPGNILAVALGVGLMRRSKWSRRIVRALSLFAAGVAALQLGIQVAAWRFDSNALLAGATLVFSAVYVWYFGRPHVKQQFQARSQPARLEQATPEATAAMPAQPKYSRADLICACIEILLGIAAVALLWHLHGMFGVTPLLDIGEGPGVADADGLVKTFMFVCLALLLSPHVLTTVASIGILVGRATTNLARRYALIACWSVVGCLLLTAWLVERPGLAFDTHSARMLVALCGFSLVWHLCFLYVLARARPAANAQPAQRKTA